jgi:hypothetical protein
VGAQHQSARVAKAQQFCWAKPMQGTVLPATSFHGFILNWDIKCSGIDKDKWGLCCNNNKDDNNKTQAMDCPKKGEWAGLSM